MNKGLTSERSSLEAELDALKDKVSVSHKELKDVNTQRKKTMEEFSDLNDKLAEIRSQKLKLTRLVREKEEEIGKEIYLFRDAVTIVCVYFYERKVHELTASSE